MASLERINGLPASEASAEFLRCCGSKAWAGKMAAARPFKDSAALLAAADGLWQGLAREDWYEAFSAHPKIGDAASLRERFSETREWARREQAGVGAANEATLKALAEANARYEEKYGYIFIVCATGKSAAEMLHILQKRLDNDRQSEVLIAAEEQRKITRLRLEKLLAGA